MPAWLLPALLGGASFLGGALNNRAKKGTQTTTQQDSPAASGLNDLLLSRARERLKAGIDFGGYQAEGMKNINNTFGDVRTSVNADLTARGLTDSPAAAAPLTRLEGSRGAALSQFTNTLPLVRRQMEDEDLSMASRLYAMQPRTMTSTGTQPGNMAGGGFSDMSSVMAFLYGMGAFGQGGGTQMPPWQQISQPGRNLFMIPRV